ncbi:MAG: hypothetical protein JWM71_1721 [Solirubrobacteraceae bacterium]|nr:hypothetical protein [Solirubrobacteraceae bacterium]
MGLLDDAIREHLELKRRRGADSSEVARQEQEAFGPPRREDFHTAQAVVDVHDEPALDDPGTFAAEAPTSLHAVPAEPATEAEPHVQHEPPAPHGDPADALPPAHEEHLPAAEPHPVAEHQVVQPPPAPLVPEPIAQPTREFDASELREATETHEPAPTPEPVPEPEPAPPAPRADEEEESSEDADVLEETPEFLQETPEHDRLWFEQRPPRDFDF